MKKLILSIFIVVFALSLNAQQQGKIRVGLDLGLGLPNAGAGLDGGIDVRYNIMDNLNVGLKFNGDILLKDLNSNLSTNTTSITACVMSSSLATSDYYFNKGNTIFAPFLGGGLGFYDIANIQVTASGSTEPTPPTNTSVFKIENKFGGLLRGGFELGHFRMALEYYLVPQSTLVDINNVAVGQTNNSFLNLSVGFYFGGGHWKK